MSGLTRSAGAAATGVDMGTAEAVRSGVMSLYATLTLRWASR